MMIEVRAFATLGGANHGWLDAKHHFSFANYHDPRRMGWGALRVLNDDAIAARSGFPPHPHRDMEIVTYVRSGAITHEDSLGNRGRTEAGDVQVMSTGTGVRHAEYNLEDAPATLFQLWIEPSQAGGEPHWSTAKFPKADRSGAFEALASGSSQDAGALPIRADARVLGATLRPGDTANYALTPSRHAYLVVAAGAVEVNGVRLQPRDGAAITNETELRVTALEDAEVVLVDAA